MFSGSQLGTVWWWNWQPIDALNGVVGVTFFDGSTIRSSVLEQRKWRVKICIKSQARTVVINHISRYSSLRIIMSVSWKIDGREQEKCKLSFKIFKHENVNRLFSRSLWRFSSDLHLVDSYWFQENRDDTKKWTSDSSSASSKTLFFVSLLV